IAPSTAMRTTAKTAKLSTASALWPKILKTTSPNQPLRGFDCSTESTTTLTGHGSRTSVSVSPTTATPAIDRVIQYGRINCATRSCEACSDDVVGVAAAAVMA